MILLRMVTTCACALLVTHAWAQDHASPPNDSPQGTQDVGGATMTRSDAGPPPGLTRGSRSSRNSSARGNRRAARPDGAALSRRQPLERRSARAARLHAARRHPLPGILEVAEIERDEATRLVFCAAFRDRGDRAHVRAAVGRPRRDAHGAR